MHNPVMHSSTQRVSEVAHGAHLSAAIRWPLPSSHRSWKGLSATSSVRLAVHSLISPGRSSTARLSRGPGCGVSPGGSFFASSWSSAWLVSGDIGQEPSRGAGAGGVSDADGCSPSDVGCGPPR
jgi:hypothetical protein